MSIRITPDEAIGLLKAGSDGRIHNFLVAIGYMGCDSDRESCETQIRDARTVALALPGSGPHAMHHAVVIEASDGKTYWFETDMDAVARHLEAATGGS